MGSARPLGSTRVGIANAWEARPLLPNGRAVGCCKLFSRFVNYKVTDLCVVVWGRGENPVSMCASGCRDSVFRSTAVQLLQRVRFGSRTDRVCPDVFGQTFRNSGGTAPLPVCLPSGGYAGRSWAGHWLQGIRVQQGAQSVLSSLGRVVSARVSVGTGSRPDHCHEYFRLNTTYELNQVENCSRSQLGIVWLHIFILNTFTEVSLHRIYLLGL